MSISNPPQLHLALPPPTQSFKRSFRELGIDIGSPSGGDTSGSEATGSSSDGNDRNKRARSEGVDSSSSGDASSSSATSSSPNSRRLSGSLSSNSSPTSTPTRPVQTSASGTSNSAAEIQGTTVDGMDDVTMADSPVSPVSEEHPRTSSSIHSFTLSFLPNHNESFRNSMDRFMEFDSHISALRHSPNVSPITPDFGGQASSSRRAPNFDPPSAPLGLRLSSGDLNRHEVDFRRATSSGAHAGEGSSLRLRGPARRSNDNARSSFPGQASLSPNVDVQSPFRDPPPSATFRETLSSHHRSQRAQPDVVLERSPFSYARDLTMGPDWELRNPRPRFPPGRSPMISRSDLPSQDQTDPSTFLRDMSNSTPTPPLLQPGQRRTSESAEPRGGLFRLHPSLSPPLLFPSEFLQSPPVSSPASPLLRPERSPTLESQPADVWDRNGVRQTQPSSSVRWPFHRLPSMNLPSQSDSSSSSPGAEAETAGFQLGGGSEMGNARNRLPLAGTSFRERFRSLPTQDALPLPPRNLPNPPSSSSSLLPPVRQRESPTSDFRPFETEEEERMSLREHVSSLLENLSAAPIVPLALSPPHQNEQTHVAVEASGRRTATLHAEAMRQLRLLRDDLSPRPGSSSTSEQTEGVRNLPQVTWTDRPPREPSVEFRRYVSNIPEPSVRPLSLSSERSRPRDSLSERLLHVAASEERRQENDRRLERLRQRRRTLLNHPLYNDDLGLRDGLSPVEPHSYAVTHANPWQNSLDAGNGGSEGGYLMSADEWEFWHLPPRSSVGSEPLLENENDTHPHLSGEPSGPHSGQRRTGATTGAHARRSMPTSSLFPNPIEPTERPISTATNLAPITHSVFSDNLTELDYHRGMPTGPFDMGGRQRSAGSGSNGSATTGPQQQPAVAPSSSSFLAPRRNARAEEHERVRSVIRSRMLDRNNTDAQRSGPSNYLPDPFGFRHAAGRRSSDSEVSGPQQNGQQQQPAPGHNIPLNRNWGDRPSRYSSIDTLSSSELAAHFAVPTPPPAGTNVGHAQNFPAHTPQVGQYPSLPPLPRVSDGQWPNALFVSPSHSPRSDSPEIEIRNSLGVSSRGPISSIVLPNYLREIPATEQDQGATFEMQFPPEPSTSQDMFTSTGRRLPRPASPPNLTLARPNTNNPWEARQRRRSVMNDPRPPSLPPFPFERLSPPYSANDHDNGMHSMLQARFGDDVHPRLLGERSVRRPQAQAQAQGQASTHQHVNQDANRRERQAVHNAVTRRIRADPTRQSAAQRDRPSTGEQGFQHAMDVLRNDGLSATRQQQFQTAFQRERQHREDARRRWGEIADDGEDSNQRNTLSSFSEAVRRRRSAIGVRVRPELAGSGASGVRMMEFGSRRRSPSPLRGSRESSDGLSSFTSNANRRLAHYRARARLGQYQHDDPLHSDITHAFPGFRLRHRLSGNIGDYVRDEDFDSSYENLLALAASLGEARPRATPSHVIASLPTAFYKDWQTPDSDCRCPICLDDYKSLDPVLKVESCSHWFHKECLEQWLHSANTCPVCRNRVRASPRHRACRASGIPDSQEAGPSGTSHENHASSSSGDGSGGGSDGGSGSDTTDSDFNVDIQFFDDVASGFP